MIDASISRRRFLELAGSAFALLGGAGLSSLLSGCSEDQLGSNTTVTIAAEKTTTTTELATTTTVTTGPERGRPLRIGVLTAKTGRLALLGKADEWWMRHALASLPDGLLCGDGRLRALRFATEDNGSAAESSAQAATRLINEARSDIILCSGAANVVNAAAIQAEALACPCISDLVPWQPFVLDRGASLDEGFKWTYAHAFGLDDAWERFLEMWQQLPTNKKIALVFPDDTNGAYWTDASAGLPAAATEAGYECVLPALYAPAAKDFGPLIAEFKANGCEVCCGSMGLADFAVFWEQALEQQFNPKIVSMAGVLWFPQALEALGETALNLTAECLWHPSWPFVDSITGKSASQLANDYEESTGEQWTIGIAQYAKFEWAVDAFKRVADILDKNDTIARVRTTRLYTCSGLIDFTGPISLGGLSRSRRPVENVYEAPVAGCQWVKGSRYAWEPRVIATGPDSDLTVTGTIQPMAYPVQPQPSGSQQPTEPQLNETRPTETQPSET